MEHERESPPKIEPDEQPSPRGTRSETRVKRGGRFDGSRRDYYRRD